MNGIEKSTPVKTNIGSPLGDAVSGTFFNVCFEDSLKLVRIALVDFPYIAEGIQEKSTYNIAENTNLLPEKIYADDADA